MHGLAGKRIVVGVTGSIAAFKVAGWVSSLAKEGAIVSVVMTEAAEKFVTALTFGALSGQSVYTSMFDESLAEPMAHIELGQQADLFVIAPASAQTMSRLAHGMADDLLSTAVLATRCPVVIFPAMNPQMYLHSATQKNISMLKELGYTVVDPACGMMACKDEGQGRLVEWDAARQVIEHALATHDLSGQKVLVTAGPTREPIDPARFISNRSSGKMGYALAQAAAVRGAEVVLVTGPTALAPPYGITTIEVNSAEQMYDEVMKQYTDTSIIVKAAAVSDFKPMQYFQHKVKKDEAVLNIPLVRNPDILLELGQKRQGRPKVIVGFAAESQHLEEEGRKKLQKKQADLMVVNDITSENSGFESETNRVILVDKESTQAVPLARKEEIAHTIWDHVVTKFLPSL